MTIDKTVKKESAIIALGILVLSAVTEAVFLVIGKWDYTVLLGNLLGAAAAWLNFFLMGLTVQKAVTMEEKDAKNAMRLSQGARFLGLVAVAGVGALLACFHTVAVIVPLFFPRVTIAFRQIFGKKKNREGGEDDHE